MSSSTLRFRTYDPIESAKNPWVQSIVLLAKAKERRSARAFLIEGEHSVLEAVANKWPIDVIIMTDRWLKTHASSLAKLPRTVEIQLVSDGILQKIATTEAPDGIMAIGRMTSKLSRSSDLSLGIACERLQDPGNLGTLIRSSIAVDCDGVHLSEDSVDIYNPKVIRSTAGQWFRKPPVSTPLIDLIKKSQQSGVNVYAAAANGESFWNLDLTKPTLFVLGNEGSGLSPELLKVCDKTISIPMSNNVESLNVAMSGTLLLYEAYRQRSNRIAAKN